MKRTVKTIICAVIAILLVCGLYKLERYSKNVSADEITENAAYAVEGDIFEAIIDAPECYKGNNGKYKATMTKNEVELKLENLIHDAVKLDKYFIVECENSKAYRTTSGESVLWLVSGHISGIPDNDSAVYFTAVYDENTDKMVRFNSDYVVKKVDDTYFYEDISYNRYHPDKSVLNAAYMKAEEYTKLYAEYLDMTVKDINFDYCNYARFMFEAELADSEGNLITVYISYNVTNGRYNFNY